LAHYRSFAKRVAQVVLGNVATVVCGVVIVYVASNLVKVDNTKTSTNKIAKNLRIVFFY
jgi:hypothetical protein